MYNQAKRVPYKYVDFTKSPSCLLALLGVSDSRMNDRVQSWFIEWKSHFQKYYSLLLY